MKPAKNCRTRWAVLTMLLLAAPFGCSQEGEPRYAASGAASQSTQQHAISAGCLCSHVDAQNVGKILFYANPLSEIDEQKWRGFVGFIESNSQLLTTESSTIVCARRLGASLINQGLRNYSRQDYQKAYGSVLEMGGSIDQAQGVADSMMSGSVDAFMTGKELLWLADVLPPASQGNWQSYLNTGTQSRTQVRQVIQIYQMMPEMIETLRDVQPLIDQFGPMVADQMVMASCLLAD